MKRALIIIISLLFLLAIIGGIVYVTVYRSEDISSFLQTRASHALEDGNYDRAIQFYTCAARFSPRNSSIALSLSNAYVLSENFTKAEYTLVSMISQRPDDSSLYKALSRVYVQQGKLYDAEQMLNRISDDSVRAELDALRPAAPVLSVESGSYNTTLELSINYESGNAFLSTTGSYPCLDEPYYGTLQLTEGTTEVYALVVSDSGLVSRASYGNYTIGHVISEAIFEDSALESWVRYILELENNDLITTDLLWDIQALYLPDGVVSLQDLHYFENLSILHLNNLSSLDATPLAQVKRLRVLDLSGCYLDSADLAAIGSITTLQELNLSNCGVSNISALENLTSLQTLDLSGNSIVSIDALDSLTQLTTLRLSGNAISDISVLNKLLQLQCLDLSSNHLNDPSVLELLAHMQCLYLSDCSITQLNFVSNMPDLAELDLSSNNLSDISALSQLHTLTYLNISDNHITNIDFLADMLSLSSLYADQNEITELPYFHKDCVLQTLSLNHNKLVDVAGVCDLFRLNQLNVDYNELENVDYLSYCVNLIELNIFGNPITDVQELLDTGIIVNYDPTYALTHADDEA